MPDADTPIVLFSFEWVSPLHQQVEALGYEVRRISTLTEAEKPRVRAMMQLGDGGMSREFLSSLPNLGLIACIPVGFEAVDVDWCRARGIVVTAADGLNAEDCADLAMGLLLGAWRNVAAGDRLVRAGAWARERLAPRPGLRGHKVGIVGLGHIGEAIALRCEPFGLEVSWWGPNAKPARWPRAASLMDLARDSDILVVACRASPTNRGMISAEVIDALGPDGMIVNVARGSIIDEDALIAALKEGRLGRAGLDVFQQEPTPAERWADVPGTVLTPHSAGATTNSIPLLGAQALENVRRFMAGEAVTSPVRA
jgi:lactate dehydrogenase-like 2-hydroxyacid dehydrogenase